jgi:Domain of unknown function (DUF202)
VIQSDLSTVDTDIRKPDTGNVTIDRPTPYTSNPNTESTATPDHLPSPPHGRTIYTEPVSEGEDDEDMMGGIAVDEVGSARVPLGEALEAIAWREKQMKAQEAAMETEVARRREAAGAAPQSDDEQDARKSFSKKRAPVPAPLERLSIDPLAPASVFDKSLQKKLKGRARFHGSDEEDQGEGAETVGQSSRMADADPEYIRQFIASPGKRIAVPVRVEPKVFFAQERTFLVSVISSIPARRLYLHVSQKWLHFGVLIGTVATALLNFSKPGDRAGLICASAFVIAALMAIAYSAAIFHHRVEGLRARSSDALYYDPWGPSILCFALVAATTVNFVFQWPF